MFKNQLGRADYAALVSAYKQRAASELSGGLKVTILRSFRADSNTVLVRWKGTWRSGGATVEGNSTYKLGEDGLLADHIDQYQARREERERQGGAGVFRVVICNRRTCACR